MSRQASEILVSSIVAASLKALETVRKGTHIVEAVLEDERGERLLESSQDLAAGGSLLLKGVSRFRDERFSCRK